MEDNQKEPESLWQKTPVPNLVRYAPSRMLFARIRVKGKLIRRSLKTKTLSVAKLRLSDLEKSERQIAEHSTAYAEGKMTFEDAHAIFRQRLEGDSSLKPRTKAHREERIHVVLKTWPALGKMDVRKLTKQDCLSWAAGYKSSAENFNKTVQTLRRVCSTEQDVYILASKVADILGNSKKTVTNPYRFVFLDGCETGLGNDWPRAFGIFPKHNSVAARCKLGPQAYVGWGGKSSAWTGGSYDRTNPDGSVDEGSFNYSASQAMAWAYSQTLSTFYWEWQWGTPLAQCIADASVADGVQLPLSVRHKPNRFKISSLTGPAPSGGGYEIWITQNYMPPIYVIGHSGLTRTTIKSEYDGCYARRFWNNW